MVMVTLPEDFPPLPQSLIIPHPAFVTQHQPGSKPHSNVEITFQTSLTKSNFRGSSACLLISLFMSGTPHPNSYSISILQRNILGLNYNYPTSSLTIVEDHFDIIQGTLLPATTNFFIEHYTAFHCPYIPYQFRGILIFVKSSIHCKITPPPDCGRNIECMGVKLTLLNTDLHIFNIFRPPWADCDLENEELFGITTNVATVISGDFSALHPSWNDPSTSSATKEKDTGHYIHELLNSFTDVAVLSNGAATHICGINYK